MSGYVGLTVNSKHACEYNVTHYRNRPSYADAYRTAQAPVQQVTLGPEAYLFFHSGIHL